MLLREKLVEVLAGPAVIRPNLAFCRRVGANFHRDISYPKYGVFMHDQLLLVDNNVRKVFDGTDRHIDCFRIHSSELRIDRMYYDSILADKVRRRLRHSTPYVDRGVCRYLLANCFVRHDYNRRPKMPFERRKMFANLSIRTGPPSPANKVKLPA